MTNSINGYQYSYQYTKETASYQSGGQSLTVTSESVSEELTAVSATAKADGYTKPQFKPDVDKIEAMKADLAKNVSAFREMVRSLIGEQANISTGAMELVIEIDAKLQITAAEAVAEDGYFGVKQTSERILDFAIALSGGDPSKIDLLQSAFKMGFSQVEKLFGDDMPDISKQTMERVLEGFEAWRSGGVEGYEAWKNGTAEAEAGESAETTA